MSGKTGEIENDQRGRTQLSRHGHCHKSPQISQQSDSKNRNSVQYLPFQ